MKQSKQKPLNTYTKISIITIIAFLALFFGTLIISVIVKTVLINNSISETKSSIYLYAGSKSEQIAPDDFKSELFQRESTDISSATASTIKDNHGEVAGATTQYKLEKTISVIDQSTIKDFLLPEATELSKADIPLALPTSMSKYHQSELDFLKELAPDTTFITIATVPDLDHVYLVDDNSEKISSFLSTTIHLNDIEQLTNFTITNATVAKFGSLSSAQAYLKTLNDKNSHQKTIVEALFGITAGGSSPIGNTLSIQNDFITFYNHFLIASFALLIVVLLVVLFCQLAEHHQQPSQQLSQSPKQQSQSHSRSQKSTKHVKNTRNK